MIRGVTSRPALIRTCFRRVATIPAALSVSAHVSQNGMLRVPILLRFMDSALWHDGDFVSLLEGHDAFCVAQSIRVPPYARQIANFPLLSLTPDQPRAEPHSVQPAALEASSWIEEFGTSSVTIGASVLAVGAGHVACAARKFVRTADGRPLPWNADEQVSLARMVEVDHASRSRALKSADAVLPAVRQLPRPSDSPVRVLFKSLVLPSMIGAGGHFDHAAMLELLMDAHLLAGGTEEPHARFEACINYLGQARVGDVVEAVAAPDGTLALRLATALLIESTERALLSTLCVSSRESSDSEI